jgi:hypothetical protein
MRRFDIGDLICVDHITGLPVKLGLGKGTPKDFIGVVVESDSTSFTMRLSNGGIMFDVVVMNSWEEDDGISHAAHIESHEGLGRGAMDSEYLQVLWQVAAVEGGVSLQSAPSQIER